MRRSYKFRLRPTAKQHVALDQCLDAHRELYNAGLQERRDAYDRVVKKSPSYFSRVRPKSIVFYSTQSAQLTEIRGLRPDIARWSFSSQQATLRRLNKAFEGFFARRKANRKAGYPRFKPAHRFDSVEWPKDGDGCKWQPEARRVYLQGIGHVKVTVHRGLVGRVKTIQVKRDGKKWNVILSCDDIPAEPLEPSGKAVGVDLGIASFVTTSYGEHIANPRLTRAASDNLAKAQKILARKKRGSNNRAGARQTVAARHRKVANCRRDFHHKTAARLVAAYDVLCLEDLMIENMVRRAAAVPDPANPGTFLTNHGGAKSGLNRSISDAGWGQFRSILRAKAEEAGRVVVEVDPRHTSQTCSSCGHVDAANRITQAEFRCRSCGIHANADENAARNILRAGLALLAADRAA